MKNDKLTIYLAGKMSGLSNEEMTEWRNLIRDQLYKYADIAGKMIKVISPCDYYNFDNPRHQNEKEVMEYDLSLVRKSDIVIVNTFQLNTSVGSIMEVYEAHKLGIPVIAYGVSYDYLHPWLKECINREEICVVDLCEYIKDFYMW